MRDTFVKREITVKITFVSQTIFFSKTNAPEMPIFKSTACIYSEESELIKLGS